MKHNFLVRVFSVGFLSVLSRAQMDISPRVARLSVIQGDVSTQRGDTGEWAAAALNQPLVSGDRLSTGDNSRAELQLDHGNIVRLGNNSQTKIATLEQAQNQRAQIQVQIGQGLVYYTISKDSDAEVELDTPNAAIRPLSSEGVYRIEVTGFETQVIVRAGSVEMTTSQGSARVDMGQGATVRGTAHEAGNVLGGATAMDSWDSWNTERDGAIHKAESWSYTNCYYVGSEDLDAYGRWVNVPDYGRVWAPSVKADWSPYRSGRWVWEPYWNWSWVSYEAWGWTPYHYGRWFLYGKSWVWWPGPAHEEQNYRPDWAPAYVSFFGFGHRKNAGFGSVGWLPLGPGDSFYPWYGRNGSQWNGVTVADASNAARLVRVVAPLRDDNEFSNSILAAVDGRIRKAISTLPADRFGTGRSAPESAGRRSFRNGRVITGPLPIVPTREMLAATNRPPKGSSANSSRRREQYFTKRQPAAAPQSFDWEAAQIKESIERTGLVIPVREVVQMDSPDTAQPTLLENGVERTIEAPKDPQRGQRSTSQPKAGSPVASPGRMSKSVHGTVKQLPAQHPAKTRPPSKLARNSHTVASAKIPASAKRRTTPVAAKSRGVIAHAPRGYIDSANREMDKGNYTAAIANYKRALQADGNNSTAKVRMARARRAMQAENEIVAKRR